MTGRAASHEGGGLRPVAMMQGGLFLLFKQVLLKDNKVNQQPVSTEVRWENRIKKNLLVLFTHAHTKTSKSVAQVTYMSTDS